MKYVVIYERTATGYSAYVPDLPGCVTTGGTLEETKANMREAISGHIEAMRLHGEAIPEPTTVAAEQLAFPA
jgi:predicted RNase H-like HicB family nuclease